jgi:citrate lyase subunit beta/citryl-CoA lyase
MHEKLAGILLPKVEGPRDVHGADALLNCMEVEAGLPLKSKIIYPILETAQGIRLAYDIAMASERVLYMGGAISRFGDIHQALGFRWSAEGRETHFLRSKVLLDAKAAGIRYPISGMWGGDSDDLDGLRAWATELRDLGYYGMMLGNPDHIPLVHEVFSPTADELAYWHDLDRLATEAEGRDSDRILYGDPNQGEGHVVHIAHVESARMNLVWARDLGLSD